MVDGFLVAREFLRQRKGANHELEVQDIRAEEIAAEERDALRDARAVRLLVFPTSSDVISSVPWVQLLCCVPYTGIERAFFANIDGLWTRRAADDADVFSALVTKFKFHGSARYFAKCV